MQEHTISEFFFGLNKRERPLNTIILDFDGVIADTNELHLLAWDKAFQTLTGESVQRLSRFSGRKTETIASILSKESEGRFQSSDIRILKQSLLVSGLIECRPIPGLHEFISRVETKAWRWGIASNSERRFVEKIVSDFKLNPVVLVTAEEVRRPKPAPDLFWHCANMLGISREDRQRVAVFEDTEHGIDAAIAAAMRPFGIATDVTSDRLASAGAERVFTDFHDVLSSGHFFK